MRSSILIRTSLQALVRHKGRSFLTILGIMIGIAAIIVTFSIGSGAEEKIEKQIMAMGENAIFIVPGNIIERGTVRSGLSDQLRIKEKDLFAIKKQISTIKSISRGHESLETVAHGTNDAKERIIGCDENFLDITKNDMLYGRFFSRDQVRRRSNVAVIGYEMANKLFGKATASALGQTIKVGNRPFTLIGIIDHVDHFWGTQDPNMRVFLPFTVSKKYFKKPNESDRDLRFIALTSQEGTEDFTLRAVKRVMRHMHTIEPGETDDFTIFDQKAIGDSARSASQVIKLFGLIAASISLLVGGIGVMNIMLVSVQERTREIGIRLAIGATQAKIQIQFLIEAVVLCSFGGLLGIGVGIGAQFFIGSVTNLPGKIEVLPLLFAFAITVMVGMFFGYYPARKASLLNPVDALLNKK